MAKIAWDTFHGISVLLKDSSLINGEERTLTEQEVVEFNIQLAVLKDAALKLNGVAINGQERFKHLTWGIK